MEQIKKSKVLVIAAYGYLFLPFLIFALGWMKIYFSIPIALCTLVCFVKAIKDSPGLWVPELNRENLVKILFIISVVAIWVYYSGIGKFVFQNSDPVSYTHLDVYKRQHQYTGCCFYS